MREMFDLRHMRALLGLLAAAGALLRPMPVLADDYQLERELRAVVEANSPADFEAGRELLLKLRERAALRESVLPRPHVFIRSQTKYSGRLYNSHYNWHLRPLFASRLLWEPEGSDHKVASFRKSFELYMSYGVDGYATFAWPEPAERVIEVLYRTAELMQVNPSEFSIMLEITSNKSYADFEDDKFGLLVNNPYAFRINGKSVISSYHLDRWSPEEIGDYVRQYRERSGGKTLFLPQIGFLTLKDAEGRRLSLPAIRKVYADNGAVPASVLLSMMDYLRAYAESCDGLYMGSFATLNDTTIDVRFADEVMFPLYKSVLAEERFKEKIFATVAVAGYTSYHGAQSRSRDGTKTLRTCLELAGKYRPDMVICPEWDELNEDTGFQPQVSCPMSTQRVMKYYTDLYKGKEHEPNPGDDTEIPNLIVSQRRQLNLGWTHDIELLNVPDRRDSAPYTVILEVRDESGGVLYVSDPEPFDRAILKDRTFRLPSERFADSRVLCTRLIIGENGDERVFEEGLPFTVLRATTCWDQTYANTPLRNVLQPEAARVEFSNPEREIEPGVGTVDMDVELAAKTNLNSVEVVQDSLEIFAYDPRNEYLQNDLSRRLFNLQYQYVNQPSRVYVRFGVELEGAPSALTFGNSPPPEKDAPGPAFTQKYKDGLQTWTGGSCYTAVDWWPKNRMISVAVDEVETAALVISGAVATNAADTFAWRVPLKNLGRYGIQSKVFENGVMFALETYHRPRKPPLPLGSDRASFSRQLQVDNPDGVLALRAVSEDGKVYWSKPYVFGETAMRERVIVPVYANSAARFVDVSVARERVPFIYYEFSPRFGNILHTPAGREFYAHAGSYVSVAIGFVGLESASYATPYALYSKNIFKGADRPAPVWTEYESGKWALEFDGERGNFVALPATFMPQRAGFELKFEILPLDDKPEYVLFHHGASIYGGLTVGVKNGKLNMEYVRRTPDHPEQPSWSRLYFPTDMVLRKGEWQEVVIKRDSENIAISANGETRSFPCEGIGLYMQPSGFGGRGARLKDGTVPFFKGLLRSLSIRHN